MLVIFLTFAAILLAALFSLKDDRVSDIVGSDGKKYKIPAVKRGWLPWLGVALEFDADTSGFLPRQR